MTEQEKQLLLHDICSRLPYGTFVKDRNGVHQLTVGNTEFADLFYGKCNIKPFLRPLSSMTEEEKMEYHEIETTLYSTKYEALEEKIDFLNSRHFDWRGLIPKKLALKALKGMYKTKTE